MQLQVNPVSCEYLCIKFTIGKKSVIFITVYRPPSSNFNSFVDSFEDILSLTVPFCEYPVFVGDYNVNFLSQSIEKNNFINLLDNYDLVQYINKPTRFNFAGNNSSLLDLIITSKAFSPRNCDAVPISDHCLIFASFNIVSKKTIKKYYSFRDYNGIARGAFEEDALKLNWDLIYYTNGVNDKLSIFNSYITFLINKHAPLKQKVLQEKPYTPWITNNVKLLMNLRDKAHRKYLQHKSEGKLQYSE